MLVARLDGADARLCVVANACRVGQQPLALPDLPRSRREVICRVKSAIASAGLKLVNKTVVMLPDVCDGGSETRYDLAIALELLSARRDIPVVALGRTLVLGELGLDGSVRGVCGVLPALRHAEAMGVTEAIVPAANLEEACLVGGMKVLPATSLSGVVSDIKAGTLLGIAANPEPQVGDFTGDLDMSEVQGQVAAKRAMEIAAVGGLNLLLQGVAGTGKTMLARRMTSILPPMTVSEALDTAAIHSLAGLPVSFGRRPFRAPHHTVSAAGLAGGGRTVRPGEVSLAHGGVLFLDELAEFPRASLEPLRKVAQLGRIRVARSTGAVTFPAHGMILGGSNPCPCGIPRCSCSEGARRRYSARIASAASAFHMTAPTLGGQHSAGTGECSAVIRERVVAARALGAARPNDRWQDALRLVWCVLPDPSTFTHGSLMRISGAIADLNGSEEITMEHMCEATSYLMTTWPLS